MAGTIERTLALKLIADVGGLNKGLGQAQRRIGGTARAVASWGKAFTGAALIGAFQGLVDVSIDGVKAFREEQDAVRNFNKTVKNMGSPVKRSTKALDRMADRAVSLGFDDGDTIRGMDAFLQQTGNIGRATQTMSLAFDIARSRQIPLTDAIKVAQNVYKGSSRELDKYGISGVKGMAAVNAARKKERGKAAEWARNHPAEVLLGRIADGWADVVGNLSQGRFGEALEAGQKLATNIVRGVVGYTTKNGKRVRGLWDRLFDASEGKNGKPRGIVNRLGQDIGDAIGKVDWGKSLSDALAAGLDGLKAGIDSGGFAQLAAIGGAIAGAMFLASLFVDAAKLVFLAPGFLAKGTVSLAAAAAGATAGLAFKGAMFVASAFIKGAVVLMTAISGSAAVKLAAAGLGRALGIAMRAPLLAKLGPIGLAIFAGMTIDEFLTSIGWSGNTGIGERAERIKERLPGHATGTAGSPGGWRWVGERGPELMRLSPGTQVMSNPRSMAAVGGTTNVYVTVTAPVGSSPVDIGRTIQRYLTEYERRGGR